MWGYYRRLSDANKFFIEDDFDADSFLDAMENMSPEAKYFLMNL
jgi:hypothetical protein